MIPDPSGSRVWLATGHTDKLFADETTGPLLDPGRRRTKTGQLWAYARDDRPWRGLDPPGVAYAYATNRTAGQPIAHLCRFAGVLPRRS